MGKDSKKKISNMMTYLMGWLTLVQIQEVLYNNFLNLYFEEYRLLIKELTAELLSQILPLYEYSNYKEKYVKEFK